MFSGEGETGGERGLSGEEVARSTSFAGTSGVTAVPRRCIGFNYTPTARRASIKPKFSRRVCRVTAGPRV